MSVIRKTIFNRKLAKIQKFYCASRSLHLTADEENDKNVIKSTEKFVIPDLSIPEVLVGKFEIYSHYTAVECAETGKQYTYQQLNDKTHNLSKSLRKILKLQKGETVAIFSKNSPDYMVAAIGIIRGGMVLTTLNPSYTTDELSKQLLDSEAKVIITQVCLVPCVQKTFAKMKKQVPIIAIKENESDIIPEQTINFEELINVTVDFPDIGMKSDDLVALPYSSGTTGLPKGVELTHRNLVSNLFQMTHPSYCVFDTPSGNYQNQIPLVLPMYHIFGFSVGFMMSLSTGSKVITVPKFTPNLYIEVLRNSDVTHIFTAPPLILFMINHEGVKAEYFKQLKAVLNGAAPLASTDEMKLKEKVRNDNAIIGQVYGLTETSPFFTISPKNSRTTGKTAGTAGKMLPNSAAKIISVTDDSVVALERGMEGELLVKGPNVTRGYYKQHEETKKAFKDGWFRTGDIGYCNGDGYFFITDRLKELIKVKGFQVPPAELEAVIRTHPEVKDVGVIGIPHPTQGEVPRAYIVPKNKNNFDVEQLKNFVASKVAKYKQLVGGVEIMNSIPRNPSGKILRRHLKQQFLEK